MTEVRTEYYNYFSLQFYIREKAMMHCNPGGKIVNSTIFLPLTDIFHLGITLYRDISIVWGFFNINFGLKADLSSSLRKCSVCHLRL